MELIIYQKNMNKPTLEDLDRYFDYTINSYDKKGYSSYFLEKQINIEALPSVSSNQEIFNPLKCLYCKMVFPNLTQKFRHLGYCNVNICPVAPKRKWKQLKITNYFHDDSAYLGDSENSQDSRFEMDAMIDSLPIYKDKQIKKSVNMEMDTLTQMMKGLVTQEKKKLPQFKNKTKVRRYNLRNRKKPTKGSKVRKEDYKKIGKKFRKSPVVNKLEIVEILESLSLS